jgi:uroporphyrin-III C-methyltransferase
MATRKGKVTFVGAGPGDPELITIKGFKAIQYADVILYDALVSTELLQHSVEGCKHVYVGKRKGKKEFSQDEINSLLVFYAQRFKSVVRLKGGDPYVFGRGHEELLFVMKHGISGEVIPGVSSAIAAPSAAGIPLTKRGVNESFWVITGTLASGEMSNDIELAARSSATVVILMGVTHLAQISALFCESRSSEEPIAIIQHATTVDEKIITGSVSNIVNRAVASEISSPAVLVIGKVVEEREALLSLIEQNEMMTIAINK